MDKISKKDIKFFKRILILIGLLTGLLIYLHFNKNLSYSKYERVEFQSSGSTLYANLYYPSKTLDFQDNRPLIIYCHGLGSQRDFDLRIPLELTKRGFYVAALDYHGHGESGGSISDIDPSGVPALAKACSNLLSKLETLPFYADVNISQIGLIGHSLGGMVVLMNQALDERFNVTVAWAPLVNFSSQELGIFDTSEYDKYIPVNLLNATNTHNLLMIMHEDDELLDFEEQTGVIFAKNLTGCDVIKITHPLIGGGHQLLDNIVIIESINWFEEKFFGSETINGPIIITYLVNYVVIFLTLAILFLLSLLLISYTAKFFSKNQQNGVEREPKEMASKLFKPNVEEKISKPKIVIRVIKIIFFLAAFILNWEIFERIFGLPGIILASLNIILLFGIVESAIYLKNYKKDVGKINFKELFRTQVSLRTLVLLVIYSIYFISIYFIFSFSPTHPIHAYILPISIVFIILTAITVTFTILGFRVYLKSIERKNIKADFKNLFKFKIQYKYFLYAVVCSAYFIILYLIFSYAYPFAFMWPSNYLNFILGSFTAFPIYFSIEILFRKVIYPQLNFLKTEGLKSKVIIAIATYVLVNLMTLTWSWIFFPSVLFTYIIFLIVVIQNTLIFQNTKSFGSVILSSFNIIQLFFSAVISNALGVGAVLHLFVEI
ncbi:MAG: alpha/beta hydrolase family protein [Promethearchaeota archaeon]|jgi:dienelactone hydrolase